MAGLVVQKYGGTSVADLQRIAVVADHIAATVASGQKVVVTVSAMGKQTDELMAMALQLHDCPPQREVDMLLTTGERVSMALLSIALSKRGLPSQSLTGSQSGILTDEVHGNARVKKVLGDRIREGLSHDRVVIVAGFQGVSPITKEITTLGRGGTDLSAVALAIALQANHCELYKDVTGFFTADPRLVPQARKLDEICYADASSLCWHGAKIIHSRAIHLAAKFQLPLQIRSSFDLEESGTHIVRKTAMESPFVTAITHCDDVKLVTLKGNSSQLAQLLGTLWQKGHAPLLCYAETNQMRLVLPQKAQVENATQVQSDIGAITIVGSGFRQSPEIIDQTLQCLGKQPQYMDIQDNRLTIILPQENLHGSLGALHQTLFQ